ncbi:hypothetical protein KPH14_012912, partial [Odynerus spinipes]
MRREAILDARTLFGVERAFPQNVFQIRRDTAVTEAVETIWNRLAENL